MKRINTAETGRRGNSNRKGEGEEEQEKEKMEE